MSTENVVTFQPEKRNEAESEDRNLGHDVEAQKKKQENLGQANDWFICPFFWSSKSSSNNCCHCYCCYCGDCPKCQCSDADSSGGDCCSCDCCRDCPSCDVGDSCGACCESLECQNCDLDCSGLCSM